MTTPSNTNNKKIVTHYHLVPGTWGFNPQPMLHHPLAMSMGPYPNSLHNPYLMTFPSYLPYSQVVANNPPTIRRPTPAQAPAPETLNKKPHVGASSKI